MMSNQTDQDCGVYLVCNLQMSLGVKPSLIPVTLLLGTADSNAEISF